MTKFTRRLDTVEATQWFKNGDHPLDKVGEQELDVPAMAKMYPELFDGRETIVVPKDAPTYTRLEGAVVRFYRHPDYKGSQVCDSCHRMWDDHGWLDQGPNSETVHPGDYVVTVEEGLYVVIPDVDFRLLFAPIPLPSAQGRGLGAYPEDAVTSDLSNSTATMPRPGLDYPQGV